MTKTLLIPVNPEMRVFCMVCMDRNLAIGMSVERARNHSMRASHVLLVAHGKHMAEVTRAYCLQHLPYEPESLSLG